VPIARRTPLPDQGGASARTTKQQHRSGLRRKRPRLTYNAMTRPQRLGCLYGTLVVFAILGVMFFLGMIVPAIVEWML
jgi:hypothetical protein